MRTWDIRHGKSERAGWGQDGLHGKRSLESPVPNAGLCSLVSSSFWVLALLPLLSVSSLMLPNRFFVNVLPIFSTCPLKPLSNLPCLPVAWADGQAIVWIYPPDLQPLPSYFPFFIFMACIQKEFPNLFIKTTNFAPPLCFLNYDKIHTI